MNDTKISEEINLTHVIETIWDGKWKIIVITAACVAGVFGLQINSPAPSFVATTQIKPISLVDAEEYHQSNALDFFAVYSDIKARDQATMLIDTKVLRVDPKNIPPSAVLDQLFIEQLKNRSFIARIFKKHGLLARGEFGNDLEHERALFQMAAKIDILPPVNEDGTQRGERRQHWTLQFEYDDQAKWLAVLSEIKDIANKNVRNTVKSSFENLQKSAKQKQAFDIEDLNTQIAIAIDIYDAEIESRLALLEEQAAIASTLDISSQNNTAQTSVLQGMMIQIDIDSNEALYLRGYESLEKEIELIKARRDKRLFVDGLRELEERKLELSNDKTLERAALLFATTPVMKPADFEAASFEVATTMFRYKNQRTLIKLLLAAVVGGTIGLIYVLITNAFRSMREAKVE